MFFSFISILSKKYDIGFNILKASIDQNKEGLVIIELEASQKKLDAACAFLKKSGVTFQRLGEDIKMDENKCVSCGVCISFCPSGAFSFDENRKMIFNSKKCVACEFCIKHCPYGAMLIKY